MTDRLTPLATHSSGRISRAKPGDEILPSRYRKKPVEIDAIRWSGTNLKEVIDFTGLHPSADKWTWEEYEAVVSEKGLKIFSLEGSNFIVTRGDYIIKGVKGEFYACKPDIFWMTYTRADSSAASESAVRDTSTPRDVMDKVADETVAVIEATFQGRGVSADTCSACGAAEGEPCRGNCERRISTISAGGAFELKLYGTPGYIGTIAGITIYADREIPENTVVIKDEHGRELGRIINVGR